MDARPNLLRYRRQICIISIGNDKFLSTDTRNGDTLVPAIGQMVEEALDKKCEGLILKDVLSTYSPSKRSSKWLKLRGLYGCFW